MVWLLNNSRRLGIVGLRVESHRSAAGLRTKPADKSGTICFVSGDNRLAIMNCSSI
jgi:hypothetical protein